MILGRCRNLKMAFIASENVLSGGAGDRIEARSRCFIDPTSRALEMSVDLRLKLRTALSREVRRIKTRPYLRLPCPQLAQLFLIVTGPRARLVGKLVCQLR